MKVQMFVCAGLMLALTQALGCQRTATRSATASQPAATISRSVAPDPCVAALAPAAGDKARDAAISRAQLDARSPAHDRAALERLGYLYVARARVSNNPGDYTLAEKAAACLEARYPDEAAALLLRGHVLHQLHRFSEAEQLARALVARRTVVLDYGLLGDALMEQGRLSEAAAAYQKMLDLKPFYQSYTRAAHIRWLKGDLPGAIAAMRLAIDAASPRDPELSAWAWTRLAAYELQAGRLDESLKAADAALRHQPDYAAALLARGRILLASKRPTEAIAPLSRAATLNPLPEYQWALADALRVQGRLGAAAAVELEIATSGAAADPRTVALYLATRRTGADKALALVEEELRTRADVFTLDAHAWALAAAGRTAEARDVIGRALAEGTEDARLFLHAGVIHGALGQRREARRWLNKAERLGATLLPSEADELSTQLRGTH
jgi:tetratricopeptide (TPR) repeat protein